MDKVLKCKIVVRKFEFQRVYYVNVNDMNEFNLILRVLDNIVQVFFYKDGFSIR